MKANNVAIIAAGLAGAAKADGWSNYSSDVEPVATTTAAAVYTTSEEPVYTTTSDEPVYTTTDSAVATTTDSATYTSGTASDEWGNWSSTVSVSATASSSSTTCSESSTTASAVYTTTTSGAAVYTTPATSSPVVETTGWAPVYDTSSAIVYDSTTTVTQTLTKTVTVWPTETATATWSEWASTSTWSSNGWWGPAWPTAASGQCVMNVVTGYGDATWQPAPPPSSTWAPVYSTPSAVYTTSAAAGGAYSTGGAAFYQASSAPASSPSGSTYSSNSGSYGMSANGNTWGMTYSPYTADSGCKDQGTINQDIATMAAKKFTTVRVYSTDCNTLEYVGQAAQANGMKMILGVFISNTGVVGAAPQVAEIVAWGQWDLVELIVVGNEAIFNGFTNAPELATFIGTSKAAFAAGGYTGPVTTTEDLATWQSVGTQFCGVVDVVAANLYAFFNPDTTADQAGTFINSEINELSGICSGKDTYVMECGWPSAGECNGVACPGVEEQATAIKAIQETNGAKVIFFSYEDEQWKQSGQYGVEQHWGCANVFPG